jgi:uncharacterized membrane protein
MRRPITLSAATAAIALVLSLAAPAWADTVAPAVVAQAGTTASLTLQLANETTAAHSYDLTATGLPTGASATFSEAGHVVTKVKVDASSSAPVYLRLQVPAVARLGVFEATFVARRDDGAKVEAPFTIDVESTYMLKITNTSRNISTFAGKDFTFDVAVTNSGAARVANVVPVMDMPPKWVLVSSPAAVAFLDPAKEAVFHLTVTVPASQVAINQPLKVTVTSDQVSSPASALSVRVQSNPVYLPIAGGVVLFALLGVVIYFRRKGRR